MISITPAIKTLKIKNLGSIRKADINFTKGANIIYGASGFGKTTIINAIKHILNGEKLCYGPSKNKKSSEKTTIELGLRTDKIFKNMTSSPH